MQDWDQLVMVLLGVGVALHTGYLAWQMWRKQNRGGALGALFLALLVILMPVLLAMEGG